MKLIIGDLVVYKKRVHRVITVFPCVGPNAGKVLLNWVAQPVKQRGLCLFSKKKHPAIPFADNLIIS
jgi:hypothetical protein